jgi:hypothetical protein
MRIKLSLSPGLEVTPSARPDRAAQAAAPERRAGGSSGGGGGRGGSTGGTGSGKSTGSSGSSRGGTSGSRSSGRIKSGLTSGGGGRSYHATVGTGLVLGAAIGLNQDHCPTWPYSGPDGSSWGLAGCNKKQLAATRDVVRDVCGGHFANPGENLTAWPVVGDNRGVYFATHNESWANVSSNSFYSCLIDNSDAHYGLSDGARIGIGIGSVVGAAVLLFGACMGFGRFRRSRALQRNS